MRSSCSRRSDLTTVKPETLDSYEVGFKTSWLDHRLQVDGAAFHYQYKNQQIIDVYPDGAAAADQSAASPRSTAASSSSSRGRCAADAARECWAFWTPPMCRTARSLAARIPVDGQQLPVCAALLRRPWRGLGRIQRGRKPRGPACRQNYNSKQYLALANEDRDRTGSVFAVEWARQPGSAPATSGTWDSGSTISTDHFYLTNAV